MFDKLASRLEHIPPRVLKRLLDSALWEGEPSSPGVALTFDDGPDPDITPRVLDTLDEIGCKGTFFLRGDMTLNHPEVAREIVSRGHVIGNHSMTHRRLFFLDRRLVEREIDNAGKAIEDATGVSCDWFRPPHGLFGVTCAEAVKQRGCVMTLWTVLSGDYSGDSADMVVTRAEPFIRNGAIIVFHDTVGGGGTALPGILGRIGVSARAKNVSFTAIDSLTFKRDMELAVDVDDI